MSPHVLFHVNHLWGVGHFVRVAVLANALAAKGARVTVLSGNTPVRNRLAAGVRLIALPVLRSPDTDYERLVTGEGEPPGEAHSATRRAMIHAVLNETAPDIVVTETFPFGRRKLAAEILDLIASARRLNPGLRVFASVRDAPAAPQKPARYDECAARLTADYDGVLVHGEERLIRFSDCWAGAVTVPLVYTGYVTTAAVPPPAAKREGVIVSAGAGGSGRAVIDAVLAARQLSPWTDKDFTLVTGPSGRAPTEARLPPRTQVFQRLDDLPQRLAQAALSVSRGGYNTVIEAIAAGVPALIVPFVSAKEAEQLIRARRFSEAGLVSMLEEQSLTPALLAAAMSDACLRKPGPLKLDGALVSAQILLRSLEQAA